MEDNKINEQQLEIGTKSELSEDDLEQVVGGADFKKKGADLAGIYSKVSTTDLIANPANVAANLRSIEQKVNEAY